jgi:hypothetical protein
MQTPDPWWWSPPDRLAVSQISSTAPKTNISPFGISHQFGVSHELSDESVQVLVEGLELLFSDLNQQLVCSALLVNADALVSSKVQTVCAHARDQHTRAQWSEHVVLPFKLCDLALDSYLEFSVWAPPLAAGAAPVCVGVAKFHLFSHDTGVLRTGKQGT